jgi:hypothetical protein
MRGAGGTGRFGLLLALLLVLVRVSAPVGPAADSQYAHQHRASTVGVSASVTPPDHDVPHGRLPGSLSAGLGSATPMADTSWGVWQPANGEYAPRGRSRIATTDGLVLAAVAPTSRSSRAPPHA